MGSSLATEILRSVPAHKDKKCAFLWSACDKGIFGVLFWYIIVKLLRKVHIF